MNFNRRSTLLMAAVIGLGTLVYSAPVLAANVTYSPAKFKQYKASGRAFMLDFYAPWCSTCRTQSRVISSLKKSDKQLAGIPVMKVDWDTWRNKSIAKDLKIPRRSTLVMFKGGREVGRVVAQTSSSSIGKLMRRGL